MTMFNLTEFQQRRFELLAQMGDGIAIVPTAPEVIRNRDSHYPYRFDSHFYYLTGFKEPESVLVLIASGDSTSENKTILFCRDKDREREIWDGFRYGPEAAKTEFGFDEAYSISQLDEMLPKLMANQAKLFYSLGVSHDWDVKVTSWLNKVKDLARTGVSAPESIVDVRQLVDTQRLIKTPFEQGLMRQSANIAAGAHNRAMRFAKPHMKEYEVEAEFLHEFYKNGSQSPAYTSIVAGGANACTLHYNANNCVLNDGDLLLIDAGCELDGYASDITRTFPVNGKFSAAQRDLYELVLSAQLAAIEAAKPNNHWNAPHETALDVLVHPAYTEGLANVCLQAAAAGVASIGSRVGGIPEAIAEGRTGLLVPVGDVHALAAAIDRLLSDAELRRRFGQAGPAHVASDFTPPTMAAGNRAVYRRMLGR